MSKVTLLVEFELDGFGEVPEEKESDDWFIENVLKWEGHGNALILFSNHLGDELGQVKVLELNGEPIYNL